MKDKWFGDDKDLAKWQTLVDLAKDRNLRSLVQIAYFRKSEPQERGRLAFASDAVWDFFHDVGSIEGLGQKVGLEIDAFMEVFRPANRADYGRAAVEFLSDVQRPRGVLLDPDTGIAPLRATGEHVTAEDVRGIWDALHGNDWLVLYQHAPRFAKRTPSWRQDTKARFAAACGLRDLDVETREIRGERDVVFHCARR